MFSPWYRVMFATMHLTFIYHVFPCNSQQTEHSNSFTTRFLTCIVSYSYSMTVRGCILMHPAPPINRPSLIWILLLGEKQSVNIIILIPEITTATEGKKKKIDRTQQNCHLSSKQALQSNKIKTKTPIQHFLHGCSFCFSFQSLVCWTAICIVKLTSRSVLIYLPVDCVSFHN